MKLYDKDGGAAGGAAADSEGSCCSLDDVSDARRVAEHLGVPFYVGNYEQPFRRAVVDAFVQAYAAGRTPNPCVRCNDVVKFRTLLARSRALGADFLATGHYCQTVVGDDGAIALHAGVDAAKDQSYFLAGIPVAALAQVVFPLGALTKPEVRAHAARLGLPVAAKAESQEICFVADGYAAFVEAQAGAALGGEGAIVSLDGLRLGRHRGVHHYTIGQRRGLGLPGPDPHYVVALDPGSQRVVVGGPEDLLSDVLRASDPRWLVAPPAVGARVLARIRHNHRPGVTGVIAQRDRDGLQVRLDAPVRAVAPGQQLALYDPGGRRVLGAATLESGSLSQPRATREVSGHGP
jgi:tRNA-specific 2-thiouridylase